MERVNIEVDERWVKLAQPSVRVVIAALTGLSLTFAPLFLFIFAQEGAGYKDPRVVACFAAIFLVPLVYLRAATIFLAQLHTCKYGDLNRAAHTQSRLVNRFLFWAIVIVGAVALYLLFRH